MGRLGGLTISDNDICMSLDNRLDEFGDIFPGVLVVSISIYDDICSMK